MVENWYSMEENNKHTNNSDRNIFYEYFNKLEKANIDFEVPKFEEIEEAYNNVKREYLSLMAQKESELNIILKSHTNIISKVYKTIKLVFQKTQKEEYNSFSDASTKFINLSIKFFKQYKYDKNDIFNKLLYIIDELIFASTTILSFYKAKNLFNIIEHFRIIIICILEKESYEYYEKGYRVLNITKASIIFKIIYNIIVAFTYEPTICKIIFTIIKILFRLIKNVGGNKIDHNNEKIKKFKTYYKYVDEAYNYNNHTHNFEKISSCLYYNPYVKKSKNAKSLSLPCLKFDLKNGVAGLGWKNDETFIIGFSGTQNKIMFLVDMSQIKDLSPAYVSAAGLIEVIKGKSLGNNIILCGHSLGGGLAQFAAATQEETIQAYCYNSAGLVGAYNAIKNLLPIKNIYHFRLRNDIVSRFGKLIGEVYTIEYPKNYYKSHGRETIKKSLKL